MKRCFLYGSLCLALLTPTLSAWGMSRLFDGDATVWMQGGALCFGGAEFKSPGLFFPRTLKVDERQVTVHYIEVSREPYEPYWSSSSEGPGRAVPLRSDTCFAYGGAIPGFQEKAPARPLQPGMYSVTVGGRDSAGDGARATLMKTFCLAARGEGLAVIDAGYDEKPGAGSAKPRNEAADRNRPAKGLNCGPHEMRGRHEPLPDSAFRPAAHRDAAGLW